MSNASWPGRLGIHKSHNGEKHKNGPKAHGLWRLPETIHQLSDELEELMSQVKWHRILCVLLIVFCVSLLLSACSGAADWSYDGLPGDYEVWRINSKDISLCQPSESGTTADTIVGAYVDQIAFNERYIAVQQVKPTDRDNPDKSRDDWEISYYLLDTDTGDLLGPLDEAAFQDACAQIDAEDFPQWIKTTDLKDKDYT
jgi:hypothetical protein